MPVLCVIKIHYCAICGFLRSVEKTNKNSFLLRTQNYYSGLLVIAFHRLARELRLTNNAHNKLIFDTIHETISTVNK